MNSSCRLSVKPSLDLSPKPPKNPLKRLYNWVLSWANHPGGTWALSVFSFLDSAVFPIPPLFLQVALSLERPRRSFWYAFVNTVASVLGACLGYAIGYFLWDTIGVAIVGELTPEVRQKLEMNAVAVTLVYSFVPLPYKLITIGSGFLHLNLATLLVASTLGRSARFFMLGALCWFLGARAKNVIDKYFDLLTLLLGVLLTGMVLAVMALK